MQKPVRTLDLMLTGPISEDPRRRAADVRTFLTRSLDLPARLEVVQGEFLSEIFDNKYYKYWGYGSFKDYVQHELQYKVQKAEILVKIFRTFCIDCDIPQSRLEQIEWTKARALLPVVTKENVDELLNKVQGMSVRDIKKMVKQMKGEPEDKEKQVSMTFKFYLDQYDVVKEALTAAKGLSGSDVQSNNFHLICLEFISSLDDQTPLDRLIKAIEQNYGVSIKVINESSAPLNGFGGH